MKDEVIDVQSTQPKPLGPERRQEILRYLRERGSASIATICEFANASPATVHRDLQILAEEGRIERVHGGAMSLEAVDDPPVSQEREKRVMEKRLIAEAAMAEIGPEVSSIFLEASTTVSYLATALRDLTDKVFVTNSPEIALELVSGRSEVLLIGGNLRPRTLASVGPLAISALESASVDLAFVGVSALDSEGLSSVNFIEAETKAAILRCSRKVVALGDGSKLGRRALAPVGSLAAVDVLITNAEAPDDELARLRAGGLRVTVAGSPGWRDRD